MKEAVLSKMSEADFKDWARSGVIKKARVVRTAKGYTLIVELTWKQGELTQYTVRDGPRTWASLDRLMAYLDRHNVGLNEIVLARAGPNEDLKRKSPT